MLVGPASLVGLLTAIVSMHSSVNAAPAGFVVLGVPTPLTVNTTVADNQTVVATGPITSPNNQTVVAPTDNQTAVATGPITSPNNQTVVAPTDNQTAVATGPITSPDNQTVTSPYAVKYHGGPLLTDYINVYLIIYGDVKVSTYMVIQNFITNIGGSDYWNVLSQYTNKSGVPVAPVVNLVDVWFDDYSQGKHIIKSKSLVINTITKNGNVPDPKGFYVIVPASDVTTSGKLGKFCKNYCGYHSSYPKIGAYAFIGDPMHCRPCATRIQQNNPNGDFSGDTMVNLLAHELMDAATTPHHNGYYDAKHAEVGDKCNFRFMDPKLDANNKTYTVTLGKHNFMVQSIWSQKDNACVNA